MSPKKFLRTTINGKPRATIMSPDRTVGDGFRDLLRRFADEDNVGVGMAAE